MSILTINRSTVRPPVIPLPSLWPDIRLHLGAET